MFHFVIISDFYFKFELKKVLNQENQTFFWFEVFVVGHFRGIGTCLLLKDENIIL